ncbi:hypothetical protein VTG60DRAFT_6894 [Thermothelomyces hinnuleus]
MDTHISLRFDEASVASLRLSPEDSYRYHPPVTGRSSEVDILTRNRSQFVIIETETFEKVLFMAIGATDVGSEE